MEPPRPQRSRVFAACYRKTHWCSRTDAAQTPPAPPYKSSCSPAVRDSGLGWSCSAPTGRLIGATTLAVKSPSFAPLRSRARRTTRLQGSAERRTVLHANDRHTEMSAMIWRHTAIFAPPPVGGSPSPSRQAAPAAAGRSSCPRHAFHRRPAPAVRWNASCCSSRANPDIGTLCALAGKIRQQHQPVPPAVRHRRLEAA